ncbi:MAG: TonB-dependent receptor, partial [Dysgonamonadaceae bacterium]|nr:TonB-dependent receptor [Dysgonamonadaceae bacterium]
MKKIYLIIFTSLCWFYPAEAQNCTVSGYITDEKSGETLIGASVFEFGLKKGAVSNSFGFYSLTLPRGTVEIHYSYVGYAPEIIRFNLSKDTFINVLLKENNVLQEVTVTASPRETGVKGTQMSAIHVPVAQLKAVPSLLGESDLIKALQLLPGIQSGTEGFTGFYVRGGGPDENLFLLDGVPLYDINHLGGFFSVFNSDAIKNVTLYKGGFPARFGSRLSSVLDVRMNDGNNKKLHGNISVGLLSAKINLEGPLFGEKTTFNISARRTYYDILAQPLLWYIQSEAEAEKVKAGYYFYDL